MQTCTSCNQPIPRERLESLPDTSTCVACSTEARLIGFMFSRHSKGTGSEIVMLRPTDREALRLAKRANGRRR